ncbi:DUF2244 domain-containing protein [Roseibium hamelinense]|nr:DUF2244 domain-containing protein [Roseibium hamelinense]MTI44388.1 DUF2244 domain-containing protein [Roseibium hamelinense]
MTNGNPKQGLSEPTYRADQPFFSAVLTPYRSLGSNGFVILMACLGIVSFVAGMMFLAIGAWPVFGFFGLDMALIYLAFRLNYASAKAYEEVSVSATEIVIRKVGPGKQQSEYRFNPAWARISLSEVEDEGVTKISLLTRGEKIDLGNFLNPEDRTSFAGAIKQALATARAGGPISSTYAP